jgi:hypothetical protein
MNKEATPQKLNYQNTTLMKESVVKEHIQIVAVRFSYR